MICSNVVIYLIYQGNNLQITSTGKKLKDIDGSYLNNESTCIDK